MLHRYHYKLRKIKYRKVVIVAPVNSYRFNTSLDFSTDRNRITIN